jgi:hypothetical protein
MGATAKLLPFDGVIFFRMQGPDHGEIMRLLVNSPRQTACPVSAAMDRLRLRTASTTEAIRRYDGDSTTWIAIKGDVTP